MGLFLPSRHFVSCQKTCCLFKVTWPGLHLWFTEPNYFSPRATGSVCLWKEREEETKGQEGGRGERKKERDRNELVSWFVLCLCSERDPDGRRAACLLPLLTHSCLLLHPGWSWESFDNDWSCTQVGEFGSQDTFQTMPLFVFSSFLSPSRTSSLFSAARIRKWKIRHFRLQSVADTPVSLNWRQRLRKWGKRIETKTNQFPYSGISSRSKSSSPCFDFFPCVYITIIVFVNSVWV